MSIYTRAMDVRSGRGVKIAVVMSGFPRLADTSALAELRALHRAGRLAGVFATRPGEPMPANAALDELLPYVRVLPEGTSTEQGRALAGRIAALRNAGGRVDGVHGYFADGPAAVAEHAAELLGLPFSFSLHGDDGRRLPPGELARRVDRAAGVVVCTPGAESRLGRSGGQVALVPHGVDVERFRPRPMSREVDPAGCGPDGALGRPLHVLAAGRLVEKKGFGVLVDAISRLKHPWRLRVVGAGPLHDRLEEEGRRAGAGGRLEMVGPVPHDAMPAHYGWADVVAVPSVVDQAGDRDGLPSVVLEAMACGVPVLGTDIGAIGTVLRASGGGLVVPAGDPRPTAMLLESLARNAPVRRALGAQGRVHVVESYGLEACASRFVAHLEALHGRRAAAAR